MSLAAPSPHLASSIEQHGRRKAAQITRPCRTHDHCDVSKKGNAHHEAWRPRKLMACTAKRLSGVVATSEFWYDDEQEFDAITEQLPPKHVCICTPQSCQRHMRQLQQLHFDSAFAAPNQQEQARLLWEAMGRAGPPLFLKLRSRAVLEHLGDPALSDHSACALVDGFLAEVCGQSWRTSLDAGLEAAATRTAHEHLLVIASEVAVARLCAAAPGQDLESAVRAWSSGSGNDSSTVGGSTNARHGLCMVAFEGWNQGDVQQPLSSWRQLRPHSVGLF